jgi:multidrug resistance protein, MATE family
MIMMGQPIIPTIIQSCTLPLHILFCYVFVNVMGWDIAGVALASTLTFFLNFFFVFIATCYVKESRQCVHGLEKSTWSRVLPYFWMGVPTAAMTSLDMWAFAFLTLIAHYLGVDENAG